LIDVDKITRGFSERDAEAALFDWQLWSRPDQRPPPGDWRCWCLLGGRGSGKTRSLAEHVRAAAESGEHAQIGLIGKSQGAAREVMIEGPSGLLSVCPPWFKPTFEPSNRRIIFPNGAVCWVFSQEEPDSLRGPNLSLIWADEVCTYDRLADTWSNANLACRVPGPKGHRPVLVISTTPRYSKEFKATLTDPSTVVTRSRTLDNAKHLDATALRFYIKQYGGTRIGRAELDAELLEDVEGSLWSHDLLDKCRIPPNRAPRWFARTVIGVDPSLSVAGDEVGIVVAAVDDQGEGYILEDRSCRGSPYYWARQVTDCYRRHLADRVIAEVNVGGAMVESTLRMCDPSLSYRGVHARKGKYLRAEPIAALFEQQRVHLVGNFEQLEAEMTGWVPDGKSPSPNRLDAAVYALTELMVKSHGSIGKYRHESPRVISLYAR
jgi:phage terminase large subunit-like protein